MQAAESVVEKSRSGDAWERTDGRRWIPVRAAPHRASAGLLIKHWRLQAADATRTALHVSPSALPHEAAGALLLPSRPPLSGLL